MVHTLRNELNQQLPGEMGKVYTAQGKIEKQVESLASSMQEVISRLQDISSEQTEEVQPMFHKHKGQERSSHEAVPSRYGQGYTGFRSHDDSSDLSDDSSSLPDDDSIDQRADHANKSSEEDAGESDGKQGSHSHTCSKYRFKVPEEKYSGNPHKIESWLFNLEEYFKNAKVKEQLRVPIATSNMVQDATLWW